MSKTKQFQMFVVKQLQLFLAIIAFFLGSGSAFSSEQHAPSQEDLRSKAKQMFKEMDDLEISGESYGIINESQQQAVTSHMMIFLKNGGNITSLMSVAIPLLLGDSTLSSLVEEFNVLMMKGNHVIDSLDKSNRTNLKKLSGIINMLNKTCPNEIPESLIKLNANINTILSLDGKDKDHQVKLEAARKHLKDTDVKELIPKILGTQMQGVLDKKNADKLQMLHIGASAATLMLQLNWMETALTQIADAKMLVYGQSEKVNKINIWINNLRELCDKTVTVAANLEQNEASLELQRLDRLYKRIYTQLESLLVNCDGHKMALKQVWVNALGNTVVNVTNSAAHAWEYHEFDQSSKFLRLAHLGLGIAHGAMALFNSSICCQAYQTLLEVGEAINALENEKANLMRCKELIDRFIVAARFEFNESA